MLRARLAARPRNVPRAETPPGPRAPADLAANGTPSPGRARAGGWTPETLLHAGYTVLCANREGWVDGGSSGLFDYDTRILSRYQMTLDGVAPVLVSTSLPEAEILVARYRMDLARGRGSPEGPRLPEDSLELALERTVGGGLRDRWAVTNHSSLDWSGTAFFAVDADFADVAELGRERQQRGRLEVSTRGGAIELRYVGRRGDRTFERAVRVRAVAGPGTGTVETDALE